MNLLLKTFSTMLAALFLTQNAVAQPPNNEACGATTLNVENLDCEPTTTYSWTGATWSSTNGNITSNKSFFN